MGPRATKLLSGALNDLETNLELDSHADTSFLGGGALVFTDHECPVHVLGYYPDLGTNIYSTIR